MNWQTKLIKRGCAGAFALMVAGCGPSQTTSAQKDKLNLSTRQIVGTSLIGAQGKTPEDQEKIDDTAAGLCATGVWTKSECARHERGRE